MVQQRDQVPGATHVNVQSLSLIMWKYMYIDESGDLGYRDGCSNNLVISALLVDDPSPLDRIIKNMRRNKFKKDLRVFSEFKANNLKGIIILHALKELNFVKNARVFYVVLEERKVISDFLKNDKNKLYNFIAGKLAKHIILEGVDAEIRIDRSKGKQMLQEDFNRYFEKCLREKSRIYKVTIQHSYSQSWSGLQFADLLAWAAYQKIEHGNSKYIDILTIPKEAYAVW